MNEISWNSTFDSLVKKFVHKVRERGLLCDMLQNQFLPNGKSILISISEDGNYKELYELCYQNREIMGRFIR